MKPATFRYVATHSLAEAVAAIAEHGEEAKVLAGGQSLGPLLNLRLATPAVLVDVNGADELAGESVDAAGLTLGAMTRQRDAERSPAVAGACPLLAEALPFVAHRTIRNRGTIGGSLAHADPAAELPALAVALGAELTATSTRGTRTLAAEEFFQGYFTTALEPDEILTWVRFPVPAARSGSAWHEFAPRHGDYAIVGVAATVRLAEDDSIAAARLVYSGVADVPLRQPAAEAVLLGEPGSPEVLERTAAAAAAACDPSDDLIATAEYRRHLVAVLTRRALRTALERAGEK